jgi:hypothetical protein
VLQILCSVFSSIKALCVLLLRVDCCHTIPSPNTYFEQPFSTITTIMPAASSKKRACQRANKALQEVIVPTMSQTPHPTKSKAPEGSVSPSGSPSQPPVSDDITHPASVKRLIGLARDSPPDSALGIVWRYAFEEGKKIGYSEGTKFVGGIDIDEVLKTGVERGIERGIEIGRDQEKRAWGAAGHSNVCITVARPPRGIAIQTEDIPPRSVAAVAIQVDIPKSLSTIPHTPSTSELTVQTPPLRTQNASSQTTPPPSPVANPIHTTLPLPTPPNWADDAASLPTQILSSPLPARDFSGLRSSKPNPFSSLQRRLKNRTSRGRQSHRHHFNIKTYSHLNWESDPRLSDLSRSLKALGWIRAPQALSC